MFTMCKSAEIFDYFRFKSHGMLAPFTAGWQTNELNPLIIEKSEVYSHAMFLWFLLYYFIIKYVSNYIFILFLFTR